MKTIEEISNQIKNNKINMTQIRLTATGQGGKKRTTLLTPSSIEKLKEEIINIAFGFHCDYDKVNADIVDGNGEVMIQHCDMCESDNLLFVGYNCDDGIDKCDDGRYYDTSLEEYFGEYDDALKANTREDYGDSISGVYERYLDVIIDEIRAVTKEPEYLTEEEEERIEGETYLEMDDIVAYSITGLNTESYCIDTEYKQIFDEVIDRGIEVLKFASYFNFKVRYLEDDENSTIEIYEL